MFIINRQISYGMDIFIYCEIIYTVKSVLKGRPITSKYALSEIAKRLKDAISEFSLKVYYNRNKNTFFISNYRFWSFLNFSLVMGSYEKLVWECAFYRFYGMFMNVFKKGHESNYTPRVRIDAESFVKLPILL